jgi:hypothetical protein
MSSNRAGIERRSWRSVHWSLLLGASLLLTACGSAGTGTFHPGGNTGSTQPSASTPATPPASQASKLGRGGLEWPPFGSNVHIDMPHYSPAKSQHDAVIAEEDFLLAYDYAFYVGGRDSRWESYVVPSERSGIVAQLASRKVRNESFTGTIKVWRMSSVPSAGGSVAVSECVNNAAAKDTDYSTGKVLPASKQGPPDQNYFLETDVLAKRHGRWQIIRIEQAIFYPDVMAVECKP